MATSLPIPSGETPLASDPNGQYQTTSSHNPNFVKVGSNQSASHQAFLDFNAQFGRNPTQSELNQLTPAYLSGDPNQLNMAGGKANVSSYFSQLSNTPQNIYSQEQNQYLQQAPQYADQVTAQFQQNLGRAPTADELSHFGALVASGQDPYQIGQALQQTQEYQNTANTNFQNQLKGQLQDSNSQYFNQYISPDLLAQASLSGRSLDASGVNSQLANAALIQNQGLQNFLANASVQNFQNSTANASNQYNQLMSQQYGLQNANVSSGLANQAANTTYNQNLNMFQLQQQAYNNYLSRYGKSGGNALAGGLQGAMSGAATGFAAGGPWGALAGGVVGGGLGAYGGSQGSSTSLPYMGSSYLNSSRGGGGDGGSYGPPQGSNYYNGSNNNPSNYGF